MALWLVFNFEKQVLSSFIALDFDWKGNSDTDIVVNRREETIREAAEKFITEMNASVQNYNAC